VEETPSNSRELLAHVDFDPGTNAGMESMLGFRQDLGFAGSVQTVAAVALHPEIDAAGGDGLDEAAIRSWQSIHLGDEIEAEVGSNQVLARRAVASPDTVAAMLPFAELGWRDGDSVVRYRLATMAPAAQSEEDTEAQAWLPAISARNGELAFEHGLHQEIGWQRVTNNSGVSVLVYADQIDNPVMEAMSRFAAGDPAAAEVLLDRTSGMLHAAGPDFSTTGMTASIEHRLPGGHHVRLSYANGGALVMSATPGSQASLAQVLTSAHPRRAQMYSLSLSGTLDGSGTRWRASYRWQAEDTVTQVAPFAVNAAEPFLNLHFRQPIRLGREGSSNFEALIDMRNLLAQGYRPFLSSDGSLLVFAQDQRSVRAGLAFNF
jgi:hypothetical protein